MLQIVLTYLDLFFFCFFLILLRLILLFSRSHLNPRKDLVTGLAAYFKCKRKIEKYDFIFGTKHKTKHDKKFLSEPVKFYLLKSLG